MVNTATPSSAPSSAPSNELAHCSSGAKDGDESDVDCGGSDCEPCGTDKGCDTSQDCVSQNCNEGTCAAPTAAPSGAPSASPSGAPSAAPSMSPSKAPSGGEFGGCMYDVCMCLDILRTNPNFFFFFFFFFLSLFISANKPSEPCPQPSAKSCAQRGTKLRAKSSPERGTKPRTLLRPLKQPNWRPLRQLRQRRRRDRRGLRRERVPRVRVGGGLFGARRLR